MRKYLITAVLTVVAGLSACSSDRTDALSVPDAPESTTTISEAPTLDPDPKLLAPEGDASLAESVPMEEPVETTASLLLTPSSGNNPEFTKAGDKYVCAKGYHAILLPMDESTPYRAVDLFPHTLEDGSQSLSIEFSGGPNPIQGLIVNDTVPLAVPESDALATEGKMSIDGDTLGVPVRTLTACAL